MILCVCACACSMHTGDYAASPADTIRHEPHPERMDCDSQQTLPGTYPPQPTAAQVSSELTMFVCCECVQPTDSM